MLKKYQKKLIEEFQIPIPQKLESNIGKRFLGFDITRYGLILKFEDGSTTYLKIDEEAGEGEESYIGVITEWWRLSEYFDDYIDCLGADYVEAKRQWRVQKEKEELKDEYEQYLYLKEKFENIDIDET